MAFALVGGIACVAQGSGAALGASETGGTIRGLASVVDGDTIVVAGVRIRLEGIDAPEAGQTCGTRWFGRWACGTAATRHLVKLVEGREIACAGRGNDKYGRTLAVCHAGEIDINADMVRQGLAWAFVKYSRTYVDVEAEARALRVGIWQGDAVPAWEYRARRWDVADDSAPRGCAIKGNVSRAGHIYHMPWSPWYDRIRLDKGRGERWFCSEAEAQAAGWRPAMLR